MHPDHAACTSMLKSSRPTSKLARWALVIQEMNVEIRYKDGKGNTNADALSRNSFATVSVVHVNSTDCAHALPTEVDAEANGIIEVTERGFYSYTYDRLSRVQEAA